MAQHSIEWVTRSPQIEYPVNKITGPQVEDHPLKAITVTERIPRRILSSQTSTGRTTPVIATPTSFIDISTALEGIDPLTKFAIEEMDPLTAIANETAKASCLIKSTSDKTEVDSWDVRKVAILNQFTTSEKISIVTSFLNDDEQVVVKAQSSSIDKVQSKLEQLDYFEEGSQKKFDLSQVEYIKRIDLLNKELVSAWTSEQRVKSLKIAIQCAKMLSDTEVMQFYPSKFVLITEILDVFGRLVYERLRSKAYYIRPGTKIPTIEMLPLNFTPDMVPESAKETCRNWFYKIASIRELVPRIYVEMAILKSYSFLTSSEYSAGLMRLTHMIRGIGNPLVSLYARCYLCRVGLTVTTPGKENSFLMANFYDFLGINQHLLAPSVMLDLNKKKMTVASYLTLYTPALDFILSQVATQGGEVLLHDVLERCKNIKNSSLMLNTIMSVFKPSFIAHRCLNFLEMITKNDDRGFPLHVLLRTLGLCVTVCPPPFEDRKRVLAIVWNQLSQIRKCDQYLNCVEPWAQYAVQHFMGRDGEVNLILGDIVQHIIAERIEKPFDQLKIVVETIVNNVPDIEALVAMDYFLPLIDLFQQEHHKVDVCKIILTAWNTPQQSQPITDPIIINTVTHICSALHDSVNALTIDDEVRQISELISATIRKVDYGRDFEQQLTFYVESRGAYSNLYSVLTQLVHCVNFLAVRTRSIVNGHHTRKTGAFVRACAAYCFITIPSISSVKTRLELYLHSGQIALFNSCLGQADAFFKAALAILHEVNAVSMMESVLPKNSDEFLLSYVRNFLSLLIVVPDSPDKGVLHLTRILLNFVQNYEWNSVQMLAEVYLNVLDMLAAMGQDTYPYYVDKVESNDSLYGSDPKFTGELNKIATIVLNELLNKLKEIGPGRTQSVLAQKLLNVIMNRTDLTTSQSLATLVVNLWNIALKYGNIDRKRMGILPSSRYLTKKYTNDEEIYNQVISKLHL